MVFLPCVNGVASALAQQRYACTAHQQVVWWLHTMPCVCPACCLFAVTGSCTISVALCATSTALLQVHAPPQPLCARDRALHSC
jgi:hypothetical protein